MKKKRAARGGSVGRRGASDTPPAVKQVEQRPATRRSIASSVEEPRMVYVFEGGRMVQKPIDDVQAPAPGPPPTGTTFKCAELNTRPELVQKGRMQDYRKYAETCRAEPLRADQRRCFACPFYDPPAW